VLLEYCFVTVTGLMKHCDLLLTDCRAQARFYFFLERFIAKKVCTVYSRAINKIVPLTNLNKYLCNCKSEIKLNINNNSEKL
jgi:hypothetical protein